jgi:hypothetical protein
MGYEDENIFSELIRNAMPNRIISNFVLVCEVLTEDGSELSIATSDSMTPWLGSGMLQSAVNMMHSANDMMFFEDGDEE